MIRVAALDLSLTSTGVARYVTGQTPTVQRVTSRPTTDDIPARSIRLRTLTGTITGLCVGADLVLIEAPSFGSQNGHAHDRSGLWWLVCARLTGMNLPVVEVPPSTLKKFLTGKGNAPKDQVLAATIRRFPDVDVSGNDEADALGLLAMGCRYLGEPFDTMPDTHLAALKGVKWRTAASSNINR